LSAWRRQGASGDAVQVGVEDIVELMRLVSYLSPTGRSGLTSCVSRTEQVPPAGGTWTPDAVKAIWDRRWVFLGFVVRAATVVKNGARQASAEVDDRAASARST
jgi:hypothetical protein